MQNSYLRADADAPDTGQQLIGHHKAWVAHIPSQTRPDVTHTATYIPKTGYLHCTCEGFEHAGHCYHSESWKRVVDEKTKRGPEYFNERYNLKNDAKRPLVDFNIVKYNFSHPETISLEGLSLAELEHMRDALYTHEIKKLSYAARARLEAFKNKLVEAGGAALYAEQKRRRAEGDAVDLNDMFKPEELHPDLKKSLTTVPGLGQVLRHPLVMGVPYFKEMNRHYNQQLEHKSKAAEEALNRGDHDSYIWLHERPFRLDAFNQLLGTGKVDPNKHPEEYGHLLGSVWQDAENPGKNHDYWNVLWSHPASKHAMEEEDKEAYEHLPDAVPIYRGHNGKGSEPKRGLSWTTDPKKAEWFANRWHTGKGTVQEATIDKVHIRAYMNGRNEHEVIVDPSKLRNVKSRPVTIGTGDAINPATAKYFTPEAKATRTAHIMGALPKVREVLPALREKVDRDLDLPDAHRDRVAAAAVKLMDSTTMRVGTERFAKANGTFGAASLQKRHVSVNGDKVSIDFIGKKKVPWHREVTDPKLAATVKHLLTLPGERLMQYHDPKGRTQRFDDEDVRDYMEPFGITPKNFRTYHGSETAARLLHEMGPPKDEREATRNINEAVKRTAELLGNTPTVARQSYIAPAVLSAYRVVARADAAAVLEDLRHVDAMAEREVTEHPTRNYGWLLPSGKLLPAEQWGHVAAASQAMRKAGEFPSSGIDAFVRVLNHGWVKVGNNETGSFPTLQTRTRPTASQIQWIEGHLPENVSWEHTDSEGRNEEGGEDKESFLRFHRGEPRRRPISGFLGDDRDTTFGRSKRLQSCMGPDGKTVGTHKLASPLIEDLNHPGKFIRNPEFRPVGDEDFDFDQHVDRLQAMAEEGLLGDEFDAHAYYTHLASRPIHEFLGGDRYFTAEELIAYTKIDPGHITTKADLDRLAPVRGFDPSKPEHVSQLVRHLATKRIGMDPDVLGGPYEELDRPEIHRGLADLGYTHMFTKEGPRRVVVEEMEGDTLATGDVHGVSNSDRAEALAKLYEQQKDEEYGGPGAYAKANGWNGWVLPSRTFWHNSEDEGYGNHADQPNQIADKELSSPIKYGHKQGWLRVGQDDAFIEKMLNENKPINYGTLAPRVSTGGPHRLTPAQKEFVVHNLPEKIHWEHFKHEVPGESYHEGHDKESLLKFHSSLHTGPQRPIHQFLGDDAPSTVLTPRMRGIGGGEYALSLGERHLGHLKKHPKKRKWTASNQARADLGHDHPTRRDAIKAILEHHGIPTEAGGDDVEAVVSIPSVYVHAIYHSADTDGLFSGAIILLKFPGAVLHPYDYGDEVPDIPEDDTVYMADCCIPEILGSHPDTILIDHHKSTIDKYAGEFEGYLVDGVAACRLCWQWFFGQRGLTKEAFDKSVAVEPTAVLFAGLWDTWDQDRDPDAENFHYGIEAFNFHVGQGSLLQDETWCWDTVSSGKIIKPYVDATNIKLAQKLAVLQTWENLTFWTMNGSGNSKMFEGLDLDEADAFLSWYVVGDKLHVSMYQVPGKNFDILSIAKRHGGGGHAGACGFIEPWDDQVLGGMKVLSPTAKFHKDLKLALGQT